MLFFVVLSGFVFSTTIPTDCGAKQDNHAWELRQTPTLGTSDFQLGGWVCYCLIGIARRWGAALALYGVFGDFRVLGLSLVHLNDRLSWVDCRAIIRREGRAAFGISDIGESGGNGGTPPG